MRKALFVVLGLNLVLEGLTSARLILLPLRLEDFDAATHGAFCSMVLRRSLLRRALSGSQGIATLNQV